MKINPNKLTLILSSVSLILLFAVLFGIAGLEKTDNSSAATSTTVDCLQTSDLNIPLFQYSKNERVMVNSVDFPSLPGIRTYTLDNGATLSPGVYRAYVKSSDDHYNHGGGGYTTGMADGSDDQPEEQFYVVLGDAAKATDPNFRFPDPSPDVPYNADWVWAAGDKTVKSMKDDDAVINSGTITALNTVPSAVANDLGYYVGEVTLTESVNQVTFIHVNVLFPDKFTDASPNSVIPSSIFLQCIEPLASSLTVAKTVDANGDGVFSESEGTSNGKTIKWRVTGKNTGAGDELNAGIQDILPNGLSYVAGSAKVITAPSTGAGSITDKGSPAAGFEWKGQLNSDESVVIELEAKITDQAAFETCDTADGANNDNCLNTAKIGVFDPANNNFTVKANDPANVTWLAPSLSINKTVDGNGDGTFSKSEQIDPSGSAATVTWKVRLANAGPGYAENAVIVDKLPAGFSYQSNQILSGGGTVTESNGIVKWIGNIDSGGAAVITITGIVNDVDSFNVCDDDSAIVGNTASDDICVDSVSGGINNPADPNNPTDAITSSANVTADLKPELSIKKYSEGSDADSQYSDTTPEVITEGQAFKWKVQVANTGDAPSDVQRMTDKIPAGLVLSGTPTLNGPGTVSTVNSAGSQYIVWNGSLDINATAVITFETTIADQAAFETCDNLGSNDDVCTNEATLGTPTGASETGIETAGALKDPASVTATFAANLGIKKYVDANEDSNFNDVSENGELDRTYQYKIVATNSGNGVSNNTRVVDILPDGVVFDGESPIVSATTSAGSTGNTNTGTTGTNSAYLAWNGTLKPSEKVTIVFNVKIVDEDAYNSCLSDSGVDATSCVNSAYVGYADSSSANADDPTAVTSKKSDDAAIVLNPQGKLVIKKQVDADGDDSWSDAETILPDTPFRWRIDIDNQGTGTINNAAALDVLPKGVVVEGDVELSGGDSPGSAQIVSGDHMAVFWTDTQFKPGEAVTIVFTARVVDYDAFDTCDADDGSTDSYCTNTVTSGEGETYDKFKPGEETDSAKVDIKKFPKLTINKTVDASDSDTEFNKLESHSTAGANSLTWKVEVTNTGNAKATDVYIQDPLVPGFVLDEAKVESGTGDLNTEDSQVSWTGEIEVGETITIVILGHFENDEQFKLCDVADGTADDSCENTATVEYPTDPSDPNSEKETLISVADVTLDPSLPSLSLEKTVDANGDGEFNPEEKYEIGKEIVWHSVISNTGDGDANDAVFVDRIIPGQTYVADSAMAIFEDGMTSEIVAADNVVQWKGRVAAGSKVTIEFKTMIADMQGFATCNFSDSNKTDEKCENTSEIYTHEDDNTPTATSTAKINTDLPAVLAVTGADKTGLGIGAGLTIAMIALVLTVVTVFSRQDSRSASKK